MPGEFVRLYDLHRTDPALLPTGEIAIREGVNPKPRVSAWPGSWSAGRGRLGSPETPVRLNAAHQHHLADVLGRQEPDHPARLVQDEQGRRFRRVELGERCLEWLAVAGEGEVARHHVEHRRGRAALAQRDDQPIAGEEAARVPATVED